MSIKNVSKIAILGGSGTGKTTLARNLGEGLNLKVTHMDSLNFLPNWVEVEPSKRDSKILELIKEDNWIIDGTYSSTINERLSASDLIIFLDYSTIAKLKGIFIRFFKSNNKEKHEIPGCIEKIDFTFLKFVLTWNYKKRNKILLLLDKYNSKEILVFKNRRTLNKWYFKEFNKQIKVH